MNTSWTQSAKTKNWVSYLQNNDVQFPSLDEVIEIHRVLLEHFGGAEGIRDVGLLESALYRPRSGYYTSLDEMAAAMFESLINNHPFVDGNKRAAFFTTDIFLRLNGYKFQVDAKTAYQFLMDLFKTNQCDLTHLQPWVREFIVKT